MKAIIPAAGLGTRMASVTNGRAKELLEIGGKPILQWVIEEAHGAGAEEVIVVGSSAKPDVDSFVARLGLASVRVVHQDRMLGLGHAVWTAGLLDAPTLVMLGDTLYFPASPGSRLAGELARGMSAVAVETVDDSGVSSFGIVELTPGTQAARLILEKPNAGATASRLAVAGRYGLSPDVLAVLDRRMRFQDGLPNEGEIGLTEVLNDAIAAGLPLSVVPNLPSENRLDCGSVHGYEDAKCRVAAEDRRSP